MGSRPTQYVKCHYIILVVNWHHLKRIRFLFLLNLLSLGLGFKDSLKFIALFINQHNFEDCNKNKV